MEGPRSSVVKLLDLSHQVAIVTGGGQGIGKACCVLLAQAGAKVVVVDLNEKSAQEVANKLTQDKLEALAIAADVSKIQDVEESVQKIIAKYGRIDILVNNAGIYPMASVSGTTGELFDKVMGVNVKGVLFWSQTVAAQMIKQYETSHDAEGGRIINISSVVALKPTPNMAAYSLSKAAVDNLTKAMAKEWGKFKIRVNSINPGFVRTEGIEAVGAVPVMEAAAKSTVPLGRIAESDDVARVVLFLASSASNYVTGTPFRVDGGLDA